MILAILSLAFIYFLYVLLIQGLLWKIIVFIGALFGINILLSEYIIQSNYICLVFNDYRFSWAQVISFIVVLLAMLCTKTE